MIGTAGYPIGLNPSKQNEDSLKYCKSGFVRSHLTFFVLALCMGCNFDPFVERALQSIF